jgi:glycosyltransferase involved in cell wall biosynthesis
MTTVAFLTHSSADSGAEQTILSAMAFWPIGEGRPVLVLPDDGPIAKRARTTAIDWRVARLDDQIATTRRHERGVWRLAGTVAGLVRHSSGVRHVLVQEDTDVVVAISVKSLVFGWLAGRRTGVTFVWSLHDRVDSAYFPRAVVPVLRHLLPRLVDGIVVNSQSTLATIRPRRTPVLVSTPAVELDEREFDEPGDEVRKVVMVGRLAPWKGQDIFLRAFAEAFEGSDAEAYVVGGALFGEDDFAVSLREEAVRLGIRHRVHFTGHVDDPFGYLVDADMLVHASRIPEPFGRVVVQGMWARCAVVATTPGGPAEVIRDGVDGLLVPCGDQAAMTAALRRLRNDADLRRGLAAAGRESARRYGAEQAALDLSAWLTALRKNEVPARSVTLASPSGG